LEFFVTLHKSLREVRTASAWRNKGKKSEGKKCIDKVWPTFSFSSCFEEPLIVPTYCKIHFYIHPYKRGQVNANVLANVELRKKDKIFTCMNVHRYKPNDTQVPMYQCNCTLVPEAHSPLGANFDPQGRSCPPGVNFVPQGWNYLFAPPFFKNSREWSPPGVCERRGEHYP
jgi:hypothetical protein